MNKKGFTLAEVLITLGVLGVVAALTLPTISTGASSAKAGPTLAKVVSTLDVANEQILFEESIDNFGAMAGGDYTTYARNYFQRLTNNVKNSTLDTAYSDAKNENEAPIGLFKFANNIDIVLAPSTAFERFTMANAGEEDAAAYGAQGTFRGPFVAFYVDINGQDNRPNTFSKDLFYFIMDRSGSILPVGGKQWSTITGIAGNWEDAGSVYTCNADSVSATGWGCAGSVFDNNLRVIYDDADIAAVPEGNGGD